MKVLNGLLLLFAALLSACGGGDSGPGPRVVALSEFHRAVAGHRVVEVAVPGADGARLATYVYLPAQGDGPFPTLVMRTPYDLPIPPVSGFPEDHVNAETEARAEDVGWTEATDRGYTLVVQAPGLVMAEASLPGYRSVPAPLAGTVRLGSARLELPLAAE
jgi:hypothetical protein